MTSDLEEIVSAARSKSFDVRRRTDPHEITKIAFLPGDGVGPEVLAEARRVLEHGRPPNSTRTFEIVEGDYRRRRHRRT